MNNTFQVKEMTESMPMLKSSRVNYIFIYDNVFIKRNGYFLKERIQIVSMKWPVNIENIYSFVIIINSECIQSHILFWVC